MMYIQSAYYAKINLYSLLIQQCFVNCVGYIESDESLILIDELGMIRNKYSGLM